MVHSSIEFSNGKARLLLDGKAIPACAYITYFDERSCCKDFSEAGYEVFSLCASFSELPLNSVTGFSPLFGIFERKEEPNYTHFDQSVREIVSACPTAKIFPRVRVSMPLWWVDEYPGEVCQSPSGAKREALFSKEFRKTGAQMLREFIAHVHASDYAEHIIGYQIAGGSTEEWFHFDHMGSLSPCSEACFNEYLTAHYPTEYAEPVSIPDHSMFLGEDAITDTLARRYLEFVNYSVAETVDYFSAVAKDCVRGQQIVGAFFGYAQEIHRALRCSGGLKLLLDSPNIDFFCSPASYISMRALGVDWAEHCPGESLKQHGKLYFIENDIRTCLSKTPEECRPGVDPTGKYTSPLWLGPPTVEESVYAVRKAYARQLTHANAMWWFDMWGGWYKEESLMREMKRSLELTQELTESNLPATRSQIAVLFDEKFSFRIGEKHPCHEIQKTVHNRLGNMGITFDCFLTEDYRKSAHYDAVLLPFPASFDIEETEEIKRYLTEKRIPFVQLTEEDADVSADELRQRLVDLGVFCYCDTGEVIYHGNGFFAVHAATAGEKTIHLPAKAHVTPLDTVERPVFTDTLTLSMKQYETLLFHIDM